MAIWIIPTNIIAQMLLMALIMFVISKIVKAHQKHPALADIPGPTRLPVLGTLMEFVWNGLQIIPTFRKLAEKYDGIYRMEIGCGKSSTMVIISKPEYLQAYYTSKINTRRSSQYRPIVEAIGNTLFTASDQRWKALREMAMQAFFAASADSQLGPMVKEVPAFVAALHEKAEGSTFQALGIVKTATVKSMSVNTIAEPLPKPLEHCVGEMAEYLMRIAFQRNFYLQYASDLIFSIMPAGRKFYRYVEEINDVLTSIVRRKRAEVKELKEQDKPVPDSYINKMLASKETDEALADEFKLLFIAGADTSTATMGFILICLGMYPEVQQKVFEEDAEVQRSLRGREPTVDDLKGYQYLDRVIKETLRIFPVGPILGRNLTEDTYFGKYLVPAGTDVAVLQIHTNLDPTIFPDPLKFDPDRFLPEKVKSLPPYAFNPFGHGPRSCPGSRYAHMIMKTYIPSVVRNYKIKSSYTTIEEALANCDSEITFKDKNECSIQLTPRKAGLSESD